MKQAVIITSFGTSVPEARAGITAVEEAIKAAVSQWTCVRAFTSPTIRRVLAGRGEDVPSLTDALERLRTEGMERIAVQPTHLLYGYEYDKLKAEAEALAGHFTSLAVGRPLLADNADIQNMAVHLSADHPAETDRAFVFMGHGTGHFANAVYPALQTALHLAGRRDILIGTVEGWPGLENILQQLKGVRNVTLLPLMLVAGDHARKDMAGEWREHLEQAGHAVECRFVGLGELPWVQKMYQDRLMDLVC